MSVFSVLGIALLVQLGVWQLDRLNWKLGLIDQVSERTTAPPRPLAEVLSAQESVTDEALAYTPVQVTGTFDHANEIHRFRGTGPQGAGFHVFTPLVTEAGTVFVNRGFVPQSLKEPGARPEGQIAGPVTVTGLLRVLGPKGVFTPDPDLAGNLWYHANPAEMAAAAGVTLGYSPLIWIDADATPNPGGVPIGGQTTLTFKNDHLGYALTWFGLALTLIGVYLAYHHRKGRLNWRLS